jgi:retron-type reverse transcriptase
LRRVHIRKPGKPGEFRPLGIPAIRDRVIMAAGKIVLEPVFEAGFSPVSFGFRPKRSADDALEVSRVDCKTPHVPRRSDPGTAALNRQVERRAR